MGLRLKFNLVLAFVFLLALGVSGYISYDLLHRNAQAEVLRNAGVMLEAALSIRSYTVGQVRSKLRVVEDELWIRTPAAMDGYLRAPEETAAVLADGWFKTGDLATISPDGYVSIVGRKRELILRGGYSVVPGEVEATLLGHPAVAEAAVIGVAHAELGEEVSAFVTLRAGERAEPDELIAFCRARLAGYKYPRRVSIVAELPKSATGKILKARLRSESGDESGSGSGSGSGSEAGG